ncbi:cation:proton antiporter [Zwartia sp.]|uniref:cation:proton antiporter domain-containing protein n=1 Tax=Zwartia sp. TaxID=2978004 RepID=UPI003BAE7CB8
MLVTLVGLAFLFGLMLKRIGLPPMVGFLLAGFVFNLSGFEAPDGLNMISQLGVTLLLFSIGLKLDFKSLTNNEIWGVSLAHITVSTLFFALVLWLGKTLFPTPIFDISPFVIVLLAFAFSFSSTVYAVKVLEDRDDMRAFYGKVAIGILVMQDIFAVIFLTVSEAKYPSIWALSLLLLPVIRKILFKLLDAAGHGELLVLSGLFFALGAGFEYFTSIGIKGDLGALVFGALLSSHPKAGDLSKSLFSFKELMLVGFFLSIGMQGLPTPPIIFVSLLLCALLPFKTFLYFSILEFFGLRARTSLFVSINLATYSEFALIVAALSVMKGWLPVDWLIIMAICVSVSFALAAPFSIKAEHIYKRYRAFWNVFQRANHHPRDQLIQTGDARVLIIGMGRVGCGTYDKLSSDFEQKIIGIEHNAQRVRQQREYGRNVVQGDATDSDFWSKLKAGTTLELIVLAMPNHRSNIYAAQQITASGLVCKVVAIAKYASEVQELKALGVPAFNIYSEAGSSLASHALDVLQDRTQP